MKRNLSVIVLVLEITSISLLHAAKLRQSEKINEYNIASRANAAPLALKTKSPALFLKMLKYSLLSDSRLQER